MRVVAFLALVVIFCVASLRIYSARERETTAAYASTIPAIAQQLTLLGVPNAGKVSGSLYRGAQPRFGGYQQLHQLGVSIVVDLRTTALEQAAERQLVESLGMRYVSIPSNGFFGPNDNQVVEFLKLLRANPSQKTFVHCYFGDDRTGVMVAAYRIAEQHWSPDQAYNEMRVFHFHRYLIFMGHYVKTFAYNFAANEAFASFRE